MKAPGTGQDEPGWERLTHQQLVDKEERERFASFLLSGAMAAFALALALLHQKGAMAAGVAVSLGIVQLVVRYAGLRPAGNTLLRWLNQVVLVGYLCAIVGIGLLTGQSQSFVLWFLVLLPVLAAFVNNPPTAGLWASFAVLAALGVWFSEHWVRLPESWFTTPDLRAFTRVVLILVVAAFSIRVRHTSDARIRELANSLCKERAARRAVELQQQATEIARQAAESANAAKTKILTFMSHEIRTPLHGVLGLNSLLGETELDAQQRKYVELGRQSGELLLGLINDFLDFSKLEADRLELEALVFDPCQLLEDKLQVLREGARQKGLLLTSECSAPRAVRGDRTRVGQILLNLLGNAIKFTREGGVILRCHELAGDASQVWLRFEVEDSGIGISEEARQRLFQPFMQADSSTTRQYGGTGLGLAICKSLVDVMEGRIGVNSEPGKGSLFWMELPFAPVQAEEVREPAPPVEAGRAQTVTRPACILLVEDNPVSQLLGVEMLKLLGCKVEVASNGREAVEAVRRQAFDLVLMDCNMPEMDGREATRIIRKEEAAGRHLPIVAMTAAVLQQDREFCLTEGMDDYLPKPVRLSELRQMVNKWITT